MIGQSEVPARRRSRESLVEERTDECFDFVDHESREAHDEQDEQTDFDDARFPSGQAFVHRALHSNYRTEVP